MHAITWLYGMEQSAPGGRGRNAPRSALIPAAAAGRRGRWAHLPWCRGRPTAFELLDVKGRIAHHDHRPGSRVDHGALVTRSMSGRGDHSHAGPDLGPAIEQLILGARIVQPLGDGVIVLPDASVFLTLDVDGRMGENAVLAAVVEVQVRIDHPLDVAWLHVMA